MSLPFMNLRRIQVCRTRDFFCKLAFFANLPRRHDTAWHFAQTDIGCPRSRAKKMYSRAQGDVASSENFIFILLFLVFLLIFLLISPFSSLQVHAR
jgi:hypothetical protein